MQFKSSVLFLAAMLFAIISSSGYMVGPALPLDRLSDEAEIIFKGTVISTERVQDDWFKPVQGYGAYETRFRIVSVLKGVERESTVRFRHYDEVKEAQQFGRMFMPQSYHFEPEQTYLVFARKSESEAGAYRQLWPNHKIKMDQGMLRCPNDKPVARKPIKEVFWDELTTMLQNPQATNVIYAIGQLQSMTSLNEPFQGTGDFSLPEVLAAVHGLMQRPNGGVASAAITVVGCGNPYLSDERAAFWLATVGTGKVAGLGKMPRDLKNPGGQAYWRELVSLADQNLLPPIRALAIRALGLAREPAVQPAIEKWLKDPEADVRASATVLSADYPSVQTSEAMITLAADSAAEVRVSVAQSIGFSQKSELASVLGSLLADKEKRVRGFAAMSLLSFSPTNKAISAVFTSNIDNKEFYPLFLNALARSNPAAHLDRLATAIETNATPENWWGGEIPAFTSWKMLFKYLQSQPEETVRSGKLDRYLDAMEKVGNYSSSEPRDIYAFYLQRGMKERAKKFREEAKRKMTYDLDYYFKQVDQNPGNYTRE